MTTDNDDGLEDPTHGVPSKMTGIATKLKEAGYSTHLVGKWDCGFATYDKLPTKKGYDTFYGYLGKNIAYFTKYGDNDCNGVNFMDLWENGAPAADSMDDIDDTTYIEYKFANRVKSLIEDHAESNNESPFFLMYSMHLPHYPTEIPKDKYQIWQDDENMCQTNNDYIYPSLTNGDDFKCRSVVQSQVNLIDEIIGSIVDKLKELNLWHNTLIVFTSDNGGSYEMDDTAGNNWPLRGGKSSSFEGGVRATSFVSGGYLPSTQHGKIEHGVMHIADWYATFVKGIAGIDPKDYNAINAGLPDISSINMWPLLSGEITHSPRTELPLTTSALIIGKYKFVTGYEKWATWAEKIFPTASTPDQDTLENMKLDCDTKPCLFDVVDDPSETKNLIDDLPKLGKEMGERLLELQAGFFENDISGTDSCPSSLDTDVLTCGCWMAINNYNYFAGPYQDLTDEQIQFDDITINHDKTQFMINDNNIQFMDKLKNYYIYIGVSLMLLILFIVFIKYIKAIGKSASLKADSYSYGAV